MTKDPRRRLTAADETLSPVDLPGSALIGGRPLLWTSIVIVAATLFLALTNATVIHGWAVERPPSAVARRLTALTARWLAFTEGLGLTATRDAAHDIWEQAQAARFAATASPPRDTSPPSP